MSMDISLKELFDAGVHFGHSKSRWNPKMKKFIYDVRNGIHIIDIRQTVELLKQAMQQIENLVARGGRVLFVGTKPHASPVIKDTAIACSQYYVNHRWLGGMLTNWKTVVQSIKRLDDMEKRLKEPEGLTKKEVLKLERSYEKLERFLGGVRKMGGLPSALIVVDILKEKTAVLEARCLKIPSFGIVDSNADPSLVTYPIPGNDDSIRSIQMYCDLFKQAVLSGLQKNIAAKGIDLGELADHPKENMNKEVKDKEINKKEELKKEAEV